MAFNEEETRFHLIDPVLRKKGYDDPQRIRLETPAPVEPTGPKGRRSKRGGRTDYLLCVQVGDMPKPLPVAVLEAKREIEDPLKGMEQAKGYADCTRFDVQYVFASNGHLYGDYDKPSGIQTGPHPLEDFPPHPDLCTRYAKDKDIDLNSPEAALLFQADSPAWSASRYYQDAAIRAAFEKIILERQTGNAARVLLTLATGAGKTSSTQVLFVQDILSELAPGGTCAIVLDEGLLFRTNESAFVETKRKLTDECDLWAIVSLPGGVFSTAGAGVKTNLLFFTKGKKTEHIWYYDLSWVKVGKKTPLTLAHFGFGKDGDVLADDGLPAILTADWLADEENAGKPFPSYARMLQHHGQAEGASRYSWTVHFAARRAKAREEMQPLLDKAASIKAAVVDLKERLKQLKKDKADESQIEALETDIREQEKAVRDLEAEAAAIDAAVFDLKAVNPNAVTVVDERTPGEIIESITAQGRIVTDALARLNQLMAATEAQA